MGRGTDGAGSLQSIHLRHDNVHQDRIKHGHTPLPRCFKQRHRLPAVAGAGHSSPGTGQDILGNFAVEVVILGRIAQGVEGQLTDKGDGQAGRIAAAHHTDAVVLRQQKLYLMLYLCHEFLILFTAENRLLIETFYHTLSRVLVVCKLQCNV